MEAVAGMSDKLALRDVATLARRVEALGFDTLHVPETIHDSLAVAMLALEHTTALRVRTSVTLAFTRSPMVVALTAWDLAAYSRGRFELGLGTQIRQNVEGRYGMPWSAPVERLRDFVGAVEAAFAAFGSGDPLRYRSESYRLERLQPFFRPDPLEGPPPRIWLGGVNRGVARLAGERAAGFVTHPTNSHPRYLREVCLPAIDEGAAAADRERPRLIAGIPWITAPDAAALQEAREHQRRLLAFLYSTPAYRLTLELFGWADLGEQLQALTRSGGWERLADLVTDDVLDTLIPAATWDHLPAIAAEWFSGLADGVILPLPDDPADDVRFAPVVAAVRSSAAR